MPRTFHHSGTSGDLLASLPVIRHMGGGRLLVRLDNTSIRGRMSEQDVAFLAPLVLNTGYISEFRPYTDDDVVHHNLDTFRLHLERTHFISIAGLHFIAMGFTDFHINQPLRRSVFLRPFLKVDQVRKTPGRYIGVSRTPRHRDNSPTDHYFWKRMVDDGLDEVGMFFGMEQEHAAFEKAFGCKIPLVPTPDALTLAEHIAGVECFVTSPTMNYWIATGLQKTTVLETRQTFRGRPHLWSRDECNNHRPHGFVMPYTEYMG